jgi:hypothetical protein
MGELLMAFCFARLYQKLLLPLCYPTTQHEAKQEGTSGIFQSQKRLIFGMI